MPGQDLGYDEKGLAKDLQGWWHDEVEGGENDPFAKPNKPSGTIFDVLPVIDSLGAVSALITIEKHVGFNVPSRVIRRGGYHDFKDFIGDLLPKVRALVERRKSAGAKQKEIA